MITHRTWDMELFDSILKLKGIRFRIKLKNEKSETINSKQYNKMVFVIIKNYMKKIINSINLVKSIFRRKN